MKPLPVLASLSALLACAGIGHAADPAPAKGPAETVEVTVVTVRGGG